MGNFSVAHNCIILMQEKGGAGGVCGGGGFISYLTALQLADENGALCSLSAMTLFLGAAACPALCICVWQRPDLAIRR